ncbi:MAG: hypothetical protein J7L14_03195 [Candidatus Diapherotrites archaeon]|nr:hypothetical protein [Candidatus Diapherotrites archaeon]
MGIYEGKHKLKLPEIRSPVEAAKKLIPILIVIIAVCVIALTAYELAKPRYIEYSFTINPLDLSEETLTELQLTIKNPLKETAKNVVVRVYPEAKDELVVFPAKKEISVLDETRKLSFVIRPTTEKTILSGRYIINIELIVADKTYRERAILEIKNG